MPTSMTSAAVCLAILLAAVPAFGQSAGELAQFERYVAQGQLRFESGEFLAAIDAFEKAEAIYAHPKISARIIESRVELGHCSKARERLQSLSDDEKSALMGDRLESVSAGVEQCRPMGTLEVTCKPAKLRLEADRGEVRCDEPVRVPAGERRLVGRLDGFETSEVTVIVDEASTSEVSMALTQPSSRTSTPIESDGPSVLPIVGWSAVGAGAVALTAAVIVDAGTLRRQREIQQASDASDFRRVRQLEAEARSKRALTTGLLVAGGVVAAGGVGVLLFDGLSSEADASSRASIRLGFNRVSLRLRW